MHKQPRYQRRRIALSAIIFIACLSGSALFLYVQTSIWLNAQQQNAMALAKNQLNSLFSHVQRSAQSMYGLAGAPCTTQTIEALRRQLAITPNVGNIELAASGEVYCSSLQGEVPRGADRRKSYQLYLASDIKALNGHPFVLFHLQNGNYGLYTSTDGYYIRNILESASEHVPVILSTAWGWMSQDGKVHPSTYTASDKAIVIQSGSYPFSLAAAIHSGNVIQTCLEDGRLMIAILILLSAAAALFSYLWTGRPRTPEKLLTEAMKNRELHPYFQPIVKGKHPAPVGCEVLVRWLHKGNIIPPDQFIPMAEQTGLIIPLTQQLIIDVTDKFAAHYQTSTPFYISFNISARHLQSASIEDDFDYFLRRVGSNINLVLEITEREMLTGNDTALNNIERFKARGVRFALDDFGTGYSTLEILHQMPVDIIKIDKLFTSGIGVHRLCNDIIGNITDLATRIGAAVIAEGVETEAQVDFLRHQGDIAYQGYFFSRPLSVDAFKNWLSANAAAGEP